MPIKKIELSDEEVAGVNRARRNQQAAAELAAYGCTALVPPGWAIQMRRASERSPDDNGGGWMLMVFVANMGDQDRSLLLWARPPQGDES